MALRIFTCRDCGHRMRFSHNHCGKCFARKEAYQQPLLWYAIAVILVLLLVFGLVQWIISQI